MTYYSNQLKTHIIDPVYDRTNFRTEFRLEPESLYLCDARLVNIGATSASGGKTFNELVGCYGVIKQISLQDDSQVLDQLLEANKFLAFKQYNKPNQVSQDLSVHLTQNSIASASSQNVGAQTVAKIETWNVVGNASGTNASPYAGSLGWLSLKEVFPLLGALDTQNKGIVDTTFFKNLKVVIEYHTDPNEYMKDASDTVPQTVEPQLIIDEIIGENPLSKYKGFQGVSYKSIEHDRVICPAVAPTATVTLSPQSNVFHLHGFNNKTVGRMLIIKSPTLEANYKAGNDNIAGGKLGSHNQNGESLIVEVNGSNVFSGSGLTGDNQRLGMLHDSWGECSSYNFCNEQAYVEADAVNRNTRVKTGTLDMGILDYTGFTINGEVKDLQLKFNRNGVSQVNASSFRQDATTASPYNTALEVNVYAEVMKNISVAGEAYTVNYV